MTVFEVDKPTYNNVVYPRKVIMAAIEQFQTRLKENNDAIPGECQMVNVDEMNPGAIMNINLGNVSHVVKYIWMDGNKVVAKIMLVGKYAELAKAGVKFSVIPRALGSLSRDDVCDSYSLITLDLHYTE